MIPYDYSDCEELRAYLLDYVGTGRQILTDDHHPWLPMHNDIEGAWHCRNCCGHLFGSYLLGEIETCSDDRLIEIAGELGVI